MKKVFLLLFLTAIGHAQSFGVSDFSSAKSPAPGFKTNYENWMKIEDNYMMIFEKTPVGLRHAQQKVRDLLSENNLLFEKPDRNKNFFSSYVKGLSDYENLNMATNLGDAEIMMAWFIRESTLMFYSSKENYSINISN